MEAAKIAIVTDPPYGIGFDFTVNRSRKTGLTWGRGSENARHDRGWKNVHGDDRSFDPRPLLGFSEVILWGAQNFSDKLPKSRGWLIWDKLGDKAQCDFGDCELAWTSKNMPTRIHHQLWRGIVREGEENVTNGAKIHPCQKPIRLMIFCLGFIDVDAVVLDPYAGSGTTLVACLRTGRRGIGIEISPDYCEIAAERLRREKERTVLFDKPPARSQRELALVGA